MYPVLNEYNKTNGKSIKKEAKSRPSIKDRSQSNPRQLKLHQTINASGAAELVYNSNDLIQFQVYRGQGKNMK